jgi:two-component system response regulator FixJ
MKQCIIVIDDDAAVRGSLSALLECDGYSVQSFCSGTQFFNAAPQGKTHCLIIDMHMPGLSGLQIAERLKLENRTTPIILITGNPNSALKVQAKKCGIFIVLEKPFRHGALLDAVTNVQTHR